MPARQRLNGAVAIGILVVSGCIGAFANSWSTFWIAAIVLFGAALHSGDIRLTGRRR
jgi:hypothetical protein